MSCPLSGRVVRGGEKAGTAGPTQVGIEFAPLNYGQRSSLDHFLSSRIGA